LAPKVEGAWNLHTLTQARPLDCFVLFSSVTALLGTPGQGNYAAANAFLDALAHYRRAQGLPALSINWGTWADVGLAAQNERTDKFARRGLKAMSPEQGIAALAYLWHQDVVQSSVMPMNWATYMSQLPSNNKTMWLAELAQAIKTSEKAEQGSTQKSDILEQLKITAAGEQYNLLLNYVRGQVASVLHFDTSYPLEPRQGFFQLGMDSLMALQLRNRLQANLKCSLSSTMAFDYPTIATLTQHLLNELLPKEIQAAPAPQEDESLIELEDLSRDELKALLDQELQSVDEGI
jgi:acyl carrier protein